ncbi:MAG: transposase, partial [Alphaproteobacteria bacterium]
MRGTDERSGALFSYVDLEAQVPRQHPLRAIRELVNEALGALDGAFSALYTGSGRPSIAPEKLLRALLLQAIYSIRSERQLMERLEFDLLFRWFVGLGIDDAVWDHSVFSKNRDRLLEGDIAAKFLVSVLALPRVKRLLSSEHFSVDGTLIEAWASLKSFKPRAGQGNND